jgi:hypothetical protein
MSQPQSYPEHEKLDALKEKYQVVYDFLDWLLNTKHCRVAEWKGSTYNEYLEEVSRGQYGTAEELTAEFFKIDLKKFYDEKQRMINDAQAAIEQQQEKNEATVQAESEAQAQIESDRDAEEQAEAETEENFGD